MAVRRRKRRNRKYILLLVGLIAVAFLLLNTSWMWRTMYPFPHQELVYRYSNQFGVDPSLVAAIIRAESKFQPLAESQAGARGLMQIMPSTAEWAAKQMLLEDYNKNLLYEPEYNIQIGVWYLADLMHEFQGNTVMAVAAYNGGRGNVREWLETTRWSGDMATIDQIPFAETRSYTKEVLSNYRLYKKIYH